MKTISLLVLALSAGLPVLAQTTPTAPPLTPALSFTKGDSNITFYGIVDLAVGRVAHTLNFDYEFPDAVNPVATKFGNKSAVGMINGGISAPRVGARGYAGIMGDWKAVFNVESSIMATDGMLANSANGMINNAANGPNVSGDSAISGQIFDRVCYAGVASDTWGSFTFGRNTTLYFDVVAAYDPCQAAQMFTPIGFSGSYTGGGNSDNNRIDSSAKYKKTFGNGLQIGAAYKLGGVAGYSSAKTSTEAQVGYEAGPLGLQAIYIAYKDAFSINNTATLGAGSTQGTTTANAFDTNAYVLMGKYRIGQFVVRAGYENEKFTNPHNPIPDAQTTSIFGVQINSVNVTPYSTGNKVLNIWWAGVAYDFTPKLNLALGYFDIGQNNYSGGAATPGSKGSGTSDYYAALLDYRFTPKFDIYAGYMLNEVTGGLGYGYVFGNNSVSAVGFRYAF